MTDKAAVEMPSPVAGRVVELGGEIGQMMAVGSVLIRIEVEATRRLPRAPQPRRRTAAAAAPCTRRPRPHLQRRACAAPRCAVPATASPAARARARALASPGRARARLRARHRSAGLRGSGPEGRIVHADLDAARATRRRARPSRPQAGTREVKIIGLRRAIAQKMQESKRRIPHFTYVEEVDVERDGGAARRTQRQYAAQRGASSRRWPS